MSYTMREGYFPSANQTDNIYYRAMIPEGSPCGIVLLLHGMCSHSGRTESFREFLCENGFAVYAYDHAGHGKSVAEGGLFGSFSEKDGDVVLVKDMHSMVEIIRKRYRYLPLFAFGHSLGSFVLRAYMTSHKDTLDGAIISGTCASLRFSYFQKRKLLKLVKKAGRAPSEAVEKMMIGKFEKAFNEPGSWLTTNPSALVGRAHDPLMVRAMCADAYYDMFRLMEYISSEEWIKEVPFGLPLLFVSGKRDPLGGMGEGITSLCEDLTEAGVSDLTCRLFAGEKHEVIGSCSDDRAKEVILDWLKDKTEAAVALRRTYHFGS